MGEYLGLNGHLKPRMNEAGRWVDFDALTTGEPAPAPVRPTNFEWEVYEAQEEAPVPFDADWGDPFTDEEAGSVPQAEAVVSAVRFVTRQVPGYETAGGSVDFSSRPAPLRHEAVDAYAEFSGQTGIPIVDFTG